MLLLFPQLTDKPNKPIEKYTRMFEIPAVAYTKCTDEQNLKLAKQIYRYLADNALRRSGTNDNSVWEFGWGDILKSVKAADKVNIDLLAPHYFGRSDFLRYQGGFIKPENDAVELQTDVAIRRAVFETWLQDAERVVELGCGTGISCMLLSELNPDLPIVGADWAVASQQLLQLIAAKTGRLITGVNFNMLTLEGAEELQLSSDTSLLTVHALEQLGDSFGDLLNFLIEAKPKLCVHLEPIAELYDPENETDRSALQYHQNRNYLKGFLTELQQKEQNGEIELLHTERLYFGGFYHEAYSLVVWKAR